MLDFALPPRCPGCGAIVAEPHRFCLDCWRSLTFLGEPCCAPLRAALRVRGEGPNAALPRRAAALSTGSAPPSLMARWRARSRSSSNIAAAPASPNPRPFHAPPPRGRDRGGSRPARAGAAPPLADLEARLQPGGPDRLGPRPPRPASPPGSTSSAGPGRLRRCAASAGASARSPCAAPSRSRPEPGRASPAAGSSSSTTSIPAAPPPRPAPGSEALRRRLGRDAVLGPGRPHRRRLTA
jgi:hypothetical protein